MVATVTTAFYYKCDGGERTELEGRNAKNWRKRKRKHNEKRGSAERSVRNICSLKLRTCLARSRVQVKN